MKSEIDQEVLDVGMKAHQKNERNEEALKELSKLVDDFYENGYWGELNINFRDGVVVSVIQSVRTKI